jgi:hypothetical protein
MANMLRPTLRSIPWFEGVYEAFFRGTFELSNVQRVQLTGIVEQLVALMNDRANGFCVIPQADDDRQPPDPTLPAHNWNNLADLPRAVKPIPTPPVGDWYVTEHFATAAADCVYIGRLASERALERLATGNLYWILGLNPGIPATKVMTSAPASGPWSAASFVYNGPGAFARTIEGYRTRSSSSKGSSSKGSSSKGSSSKGWLADREKGTASRNLVDLSGQQRFPVDRQRPRPAREPVALLEHRYRRLGKRRDIHADRRRLPQGRARPRGLAHRKHARDIHAIRCHQAALL